MPKKPSKRKSKKKSKRSKEISLLQNLTKAFVNLTEIQKQNLKHSSHKRSDRSLRKPTSHKGHDRSHRKPSSHKRSERRSPHRKPTSHKRNILNPLFRNQLSKDLLIHHSNKKVSPIKIREKKIKKKMNIFNLDKKTFINQAKLLENIKKTQETRTKYTKKQVEDIINRYKEQPAKATQPIKPAKASPIKASPIKASPEVSL